MKAQAFLMDILDSLGLEAGSINPVRSPQGIEEGGVKLPSVVWRLDGDQHEDSLDGPAHPHIRFFEIECRAIECPYAQNLAQRILDGLRPRLALLLADFDEPDDPSQQRGKYYSHILEVGLNDEVD